MFLFLLVGIQVNLSTGKITDSASGAAAVVYVRTENGTFEYVLMVTQNNHNKYGSNVEFNIIFMTDAWNVLL